MANKIKEIIDNEEEIKNAVFKAEHKVNQARSELERLEQIYSDARNRLNEWFAEYG
jgi:chromosome segregation ATPase